MATRFAHIVAILMKDPNFGSLRLADLEWMVLPPLMIGQCRIAHTAPTAIPDGKNSGMLVPVAVAVWASVSTEIDKRLATTLDGPVSLKPAEWRTGDNLWLMAVSGDPWALPAFLAQLAAQDFKDKEVKLRAQAAGGKTEIITLETFRVRKAKEAGQAPVAA